MARTSEIEIFDRMTDSLRIAEQAARDLSVHPGAGQPYDNLRNNLRLVEGCCRQIGYWRDGDTRWLPIGLQMAKAHKLAGDWLRGVQQPDGTRRPLAPGERHPTFIGLADQLKALLAGIANLRHAKTGRYGGRILPTMLPGPHRESRPVQVRTPGGIILPTGASL